ncbi:MULTISPECIES: excisionase [unclassified Arsenophonus]|nr:excisionase [Arsenophonus sp.]MDR5615598.1 excisionase [Arsenophonus sp.]
MITLAEWNARRDRPRRMDTVRGWVRNGLIQPPPDQGWKGIFS